MKKGAKIAIVIVIVCVLIGAVVGITLGLKGANDNDGSSDTGSAMTTPDDSDNTADSDEPLAPDTPDDSDDSDNTEDQPPIEKTEQEYMQECKEKLKTAIENKILDYMGRGSIKLNTFGLNVVTEEIFSSIDYTYHYNTVKYFFTMNTNITGFNNLTYQETSELLDNVELSIITQYSSLQYTVSDELYNKLCDYVLGEVGLEGAEVLNATEFKVNDHSMYETTVTVYANNKLYCITASVISDGNQEDHINKLLTEGRTKEIKIVSEENYKEFFVEATD